MTERAFEASFPDEAATAAFATAFAPCLREGGTLFLHGELGAGKTTLARALLRALGVDGAIKSPTYSLIESYPLDDLVIHHLDLYRIGDPGELEWLGLDELANGPSLVLVEWPERGQGALPPPDLILHLVYAGEGRACRFEAASHRGERWLAAARTARAHSPSAR